MLKAEAPTSFAKPGPISGELRLTVKGETFHWGPK